MTKEEREKKIAGNPRIKRFVDCGDADKASRLYSMAYLLQSIAAAYTEEANDIVRRNGLLHFNLKMYSERLTKAFDMYHRQLNGMIINTETKEAFCGDYDRFEAVCRRFMDLRED